MVSIDDALERFKLTLFEFDLLSTDFRSGVGGVHHIIHDHIEIHVFVREFTFNELENKKSRFCTTVSTVEFLKALLHTMLEQFFRCETLLWRGLSATF